MIKLTREELRGRDVGEITVFPPLTSELIQLANSKTHAVTKKVVGKPQELIRTFEGKTFEEWCDCYNEQNPEAIDTATELIMALLEEFKTAAGAIDRRLVTQWVREAVLKKTYAHYRLPEIILKKIAGIRKQPFRLPNDAEGADGIDGFIGETAFQVRPVSYYFKAPPDEPAAHETIYFEKTKSGVKIYHDP